MKIFSSTSQKLSSVVSFCALIFFFSTNIANGQRVSYQGLQAQNRVPTAFFDYNIIPPSSPGQDAQVVVSFKLGHDFLNFRTTDADDNDRNFYADVEIGIQIFEAEGSESFGEEQEEFRSDRIQERQSSRRTQSRRSQQNIPEGEPVTREFWNGTAYAVTYEQTKSNKQYLEGYITQTLPPGNYEIYSRFDSDRRSRYTIPKRITIPDFSENENSLIYFLDEPQSFDIPATKPLINMGRNVLYGKDFSALLMIPDYNEQVEYRLQLKKMGENPNDTSSVTIYDESLSTSDIYQGLDVRLEGGNDEAVNLSFSTDSDSPYTYALKNIPNSRFENDQFRMEIWKEGENEENELIGSRVFMNRWVDIPTSLLNVDVAIDMMQFIVNEEKLSELKDGNENQRVSQFREFWNERDPTPETEYNGLMVEYYRRIDYAFENYSTPSQPGYESDMGRVYIQNGRPDNVNRRFPTDQPAEVIWEYASRSFVFQATTGFGDYRLTETR